MSRIPNQADESHQVLAQGLELKVPPLIWAASCALLMKGVSVWLPQYSLHLPFAKAFAPVLVGLGISVAVAGVQAMRRSHTTVNPMRPESTTAVVDGGIYGVTRNPMYVGMLLALGGFAVLLQNVVAFLVVGLWAAVITQFQIRPEERILEERFGEEYLDYRRRVPRWLFRLTEEDQTL